MTLEDRSFSVAAIAVAAAMGWSVASRDRIAAPLRAVHAAVASAPAEDACGSAAVSAQVREISEAIAVAEGYYAAGDHDGHSLPYRLNNPGALKATPIAGGLPTWSDTGLLQFPTKEMGWTALRCQVSLMLTGRSRIYQPFDTLLAVGEKYADGDRNWGSNVAARLGVSPDATLEDLRMETCERQ